MAKIKFWIEFWTAAVSKNTWNTFSQHSYPGICPFQHLPHVSDRVSHTSCPSLSSHTCTQTGYPPEKTLTHFSLLKFHFAELSPALLPGFLYEILPPATLQVREWWELFIFSSLVVMLYLYLYQVKNFFLSCTEIDKNHWWEFHLRKHTLTFIWYN